MKIFNFKSFANYSINRFFYSLIKIILFILFIFSISKCNVKAVGLQTYKVNYAGYELNSSFISLPIGNKEIRFAPYMYDTYNGVYKEFWFRLNLCMDSKISSAYVNHNLTSFSYKNSELRCSYNNSSYSGGRIVQFVFYATDTFGGTFTVFQENIASIQLISAEVFENNPGFSDDTVSSNQNTIINQNEEGEKTRKGIWGSIKEGFSSIGTWFTNLGSSIANGFSSLGSTIGNFFSELGNKIGGFFTTLLNGIIDGLKVLFIPKDNFFSSWFSNFKSFFEEKLGFLLYPFTFVIDILNRFLSLSDTGSYVINIPKISIPIFDLPIINATSFDLVTLLSNQNFKIMHDLYFVFIDVLFFLGFMGLCKRQYVSIFGGTSDDLEYVSSGEVTKQSRKNRSSKRSKE